MSSVTDHLFRDGFNGAVIVASLSLWQAGVDYSHVSKMSKGRLVNSVAACLPAVIRYDAGCFLSSQCSPLLVIVCTCAHSLFQCLRVQSSLTATQACRRQIFSGFPLDGIRCGKNLP